MSLALSICGSGMCCAVGFTAEAARPAIRAGLEAFAESDFLDSAGFPVIAAILPIEDVWGSRRMALQFESVIEQCLAGTRLDPAGIPILLLTAERGRPGSFETWGKACFRAREEATGRPVHPESRVLALGRAGLAAAVVEARAILAGRRAEHVLIAGVDSYLNALAINHFLRRDRILSPEAKNGFIPGEGAGAVLVRLAPRTDPGLFVLGSGVADEEATVDNEVPSRAIGMTRAIRAALSESGYRLSDLHFRVADIAGEPFYFTEAGLAVSRAFDQRVGEFRTVHITDAVGETGAAIGPMSLAYLAGAMPRGHTPGTRALFHLASDGGARAALVLELVTSPPNALGPTPPAP
ncbi:MAG: hypothetical protein R3F14_31350 [Polyangiaceae bacterium]